MGESSATILLTCSSCGRREVAERQAHDPARAVELNFQNCDRCDRGDFEMLAYYDADGREVMEDPADAIRAAREGK